MSTEPVKTAPPKPSLERYAALLLVVCALILRLWGITWALPDKDRAYSYHVDESVVVGHALDLDPLAGKVDPNFYNYGSLSLLIDGAVIHAGRAAGLVGANPATVRPGGLAVPTAGELLAARLISVLLGAGTAGFLYGTGKLLYNTVTGVIAAVGYAVAPLAVQHAHFATVDVGSVFWIAGSLYFAARYLKTPTLTSLALSGLFAGLAAASKYNAGLVMLSGVVAWWLAKPRKAAPLGALIAATLLGFLIGCPGIVLNPAAVIRDISYEAKHVATGHGEVFAETAPGFIYHIVYNMRWGMGPLLTLFCLVGVGVGIARRRPGDGIVAAFALPYYILIGLAQVKFARYTLPLFPPLFLLVGASWDGWRNRLGQSAVRFLLPLAGAYALVFSAALNQIMTLPDTRDDAAAYIRSQPSIRAVGFAAGPWNYSPTLDPYLAHPFPLIPQEVALQTLQEGDGLKLVPAVLFGPDGQPERDTNGLPKPKEFNVALLSTPVEPDAITLGELHYDDWLRTRFGDAETYLTEAEKRYPNHKNFTKPIALFGIPMAPVYMEPGTPWHGLPTQGLPHDMLYTNPSVSVWTK